MSIVRQCKTTTLNSLLNANDVASLTSRLLPTPLSPPMSNSPPLPWCASSIALSRRRNSFSRPAKRGPARGARLARCRDLGMRDRRGNARPRPGVADSTPNESKLQDSLHSPAPLKRIVKGCGSISKTLRNRSRTRALTKFEHTVHMNSMLEFLEYTRRKLNSHE